MKYSDRLQPFFKALKATDAKGWEPECDKAFQTIKEYIASPLSLSQVVEGEELYLYLSSSRSAISVALVRLDSENRLRLVYLVNKALSEVKVKYLDFE